MIKRTIILSLALSSVAFGNSGNYNGQQTQQQKNVIYCPHPNQLIKKGLSWQSTTNVRWISSESSFADSIASFAGAQWQGVKVGQMTCIYESATEGVFPVTVQNNHLFEQPTQANWKNGGNGLMNCVSKKIEDCPLTPKVKEAAPTTNKEILQGLNIQRPF